MGGSLFGRKTRNIIGLTQRLIGLSVVSPLLSVLSHERTGGSGEAPKNNKEGIRGRNDDGLASYQAETSPGRSAEAEKGKEV